MYIRIKVCLYTFEHTHVFWLCIIKNFEKIWSTTGVHTLFNEINSPTAVL